MDLAATFFISVYGLAAFSGGILAWAEQGVSVTALTPPLAIAALLLNERYRWLRLGTVWSGVAGLIGFIYPTYELFAGNEESPLLAVAHLISILQCILLFHDKSAPQYWWIFATSCLQIALAAVLTSSPMFGLLILTYMFWALWTLSVFTLLLARLRYGQEEQWTEGIANWVWPELDDSALHATPYQSSPASAGPYGSYRSSFQCDPHETDISWRFVFGVGGLSSAALFLGLIFFLLTPRLWIGTSSSLQDGSTDGLGRTLTGFSEKVQLGDFGRILESSAPVLELTLTDENSGKPVNLSTYLAQIGQDEPLLRGSVLGAYQNGEWLSLRGHNASNLGQITPLGAKYRHYIRQTVRLEAIGSRTLFSLADPLYGMIEDQLGSIRINHATRTLQFSSGSGGFRGAIRYHLMVPERQERSNFPQYEVRPILTPKPRAEDDVNRRPFAEPERPAPDPSYLICPPNFRMVHIVAERVREHTRQITGQANPSDDQIARDIVAFLKDSGEFQYSLDQSQTNPELDPVEDFLMNRKAGHCQYFATALALILRSAGIPSRVVTGFKGGIETPEAGRLEVQQRHAHAWVEAFIDGDWVTLDATPASREDSVEAIGERVRWYHQVFGFFTSLWSDYVVNLSFTKQQRDLYAPLQSLGKALTEQFRDGSKLLAGPTEMLQMYLKHPERLFSFWGGLTALVLMLSMVGVFYLMRGFLRLIRRLVFGPAAGSRRGIYIDFYERFLKLVKPLGLTPKPQQTQQEFAQEVEETWLTRQLPSEFLPLARNISQAFYRLRFGAESLSPQEEQQIRTGLQQLELHLSQSRTFK